MTKLKRSFKKIILATIFAKTTINSTAIAENFFIHGSIGRSSVKSSIPGSLKIESPMQIISLAVYYKINSTWSIGVCGQPTIHPNAFSDYKIKFPKIPEKIETLLQAFNQSQKVNAIFLECSILSAKNIQHRIEEPSSLRIKHLELDLQTLETHLKLKKKLQNKLQKQITQYQNICKAYLELDKKSVIHENDSQIVKSDKEDLYIKIVEQRSELSQQLADMRNSVLINQCGKKFTGILQITSIDPKYRIYDANQAQLLATVYTRNNLSVELGVGLGMIKILKIQGFLVTEEIQENTLEPILLSIIQPSEHPGFSMIAQLSYKLQNRLSLSTRYTFLSTFDRSITSHAGTLGLSWDL